MSTRGERTREPGVFKITKAGGRVAYRVYVDMGTDQHGKRVQKCQTVDTMAEAKAIRSKINTGREDGTLIRPTKTTMGEAMDSWLAGRRNIRPNTLRSYADSLALAKPIRHVPVQALTRAHLDGLVSDLLTHGRRVGNVKRQGLSPRSVNLFLTVVSMVLDQAVQDGLVAKNVAKGVERPRQGRTERPTWTAEEIGTLLAAVASDRLAAAWMLTTNGLRRGEVLGLCWEDVDLERGEIVIRQALLDVAGEVQHGPTKSERGRRTLPLDRSLVMALAALRDRQLLEQWTVADLGADYAGPCSDCGGRHVVVDEIGQKPRPEWYSDQFRRLVKASGLPVHRLHDARHTSVSIMLGRGVPLHIVAAWHGQDPRTTAAIYAHAQDDGLRAAGESLAGAYGERVGNNV